MLVRTPARLSKAEHQAAGQLSGCAGTCGTAVAGDLRDELSARPARVLIPLWRRRHAVNDLLRKTRTHIALTCSRRHASVISLDVEYFEHAFRGTHLTQLE